MEIEKDIDIGGQDFEEDIDLGNNFKIIHEQTDPLSKKAPYNNRNSVTAGNKFLIEKQQLSFEVDYDIFESKFWPKIAHRRFLKKLSPTLVWTEIYSVIKGGTYSSWFYQGYLPKHEYVHKHGSYFLSLTERNLIYFIYLEYERWKAEQNAYDFMDVVNHLHKRLYHGDTLKRMSIDYLMVDEVQDLTPKTLQTLLKLTSHKVFFSGDTA
jgi:superfamily I DNA/RNA helicase